MMSKGRGHVRVYCERDPDGNLRKYPLRSLEQHAHDLKVYNNTWFFFDHIHPIYIKNFKLVQPFIMLDWYRSWANWKQRMPEWTGLSLIIYIPFAMEYSNISCCCSQAKLPEIQTSRGASPRKWRELITDSPKLCPHQMSLGRLKLSTPSRIWRQVTSSRLACITTPFWRVYCPNRISLILRVYH